MGVGRGGLVGRWEGEDQGRRGASAAPEWRSKGSTNTGKQECSVVAYGGQTYQHGSKIMITCNLVLLSCCTFR